MPNIFEHTDFRSYLKAYYEEKKEKNPHYSYQLFAQKCGFKNRGFIYNVINKKEKLSKISCLQISKGTGHADSETKYFENITFYTQAQQDYEQCNDPEKKTIIEQRINYYLNEIDKQARDIQFKTRLILKDQCEFYSKWYHNAIRLLTEIYPIKNNYEQVCCMLKPPITAAQAQKSIQLLKRLKLIAEGQDGMYHLTDKSVKTDKTIPQIVKNRFHIKCTDLAKKAIRNIPPESRYTRSFTMGISKNTYEAVIKATQTFINEITALTRKDDNPECVYQYEFLLFPLSIEKSVNKRSVH
jgi:uncharacterized protein (TIGR02147 family)